MNVAPAARRTPPVRVAVYAAEVTLSDGERFASLGGVVVRNRRLVLLWLRRQALRLARGHGLPPWPNP